MLRGHATVHEVRKELLDTFLSEGAGEGRVRGFSANAHILNVHNRCHNPVRLFKCTLAMPVQAGMRREYSVNTLGHKYADRQRWVASVAIFAEEGNEHDST